MTPSRHIVGCMTGTSMDALDAALIAVEGRGLGMRLEIRRFLTQPLGRRSDALRRLAGQEAMKAGEIARLNHDFSLLHVEAIRELVGAERPDLIAVHGQTVFHQPPVSWQMISPAVIAQGVGAPIVFDLRTADLAAGGQGAPITPLADFVLFRDSVERRAIANLGGFCNVTILPGVDESAAADAIGAIRGFDVCPCNHLLDAVARRCFDAPFDEGGRRASEGKVVAALMNDLLNRLEAANGAEQRRSLGTGDELTAWIERQAQRHDGADLARTVAAAIAEAVVRSTRGVDRLILAGGGCRNAALVREIESRAEVVVSMSDAFGIPFSQREAVAMAVLGALCQDGVPITLPQVTGVKAPAPVAGVWVYPSQGSGVREKASRHQGIEASRHKPQAPSPTPHSPSHPLTHSHTHIPPDRSHILTEQRNPRTVNLHELSVAECVRVMNAENRFVFDAMEQAAPALSAFIEAVEPRFLRGGRLIYLGAGTSGRLGVLDASEAPPTFCVPPDRIIGIIAGGDASLRRSSEAKEDDPSGAHAELEALRLTADDTVLGIAAGATTPYVLGALEFARTFGSLTALLTCSPMQRVDSVDHLIVIETGPEALTGSTRLKAGTATKLALNTVSTTLMIRSGRVYENLMVDLRATNAKLRDRAARIVSTLTDLSRNEALALLDLAGGAVKTAIVMHRLALDLAAAQQRLDACGDRLDRALKSDPAADAAQSP